MSGAIARLAALAAILLGTWPALASAHAFDVRYDLPAPLSYFVTGAACTVAFSFVVIALFARKTPSATYSAAGRVIGLPWLPALHIALKVIGLASLALIGVAGFFGDADPMTNIVPTLVWIIWWVGLSLLIACVGNLWPALDPWRSLFELLQRLAGRGRAAKPRWDYPQALGKWPAVLLLMMIAWFELVYTQAALPANLAWVALGWSVVTLLGMACFGREPWQRNADVFAVYFDVLGRCSPLRRAGERSIELRPPGRGLLTGAAGSLALTAFVLAMLSTVLFDGLLAGPAWRRIVQGLIQAAPQWFDTQSYATDTLGLVGFWLLFLAAYVLSCVMMAKLGQKRPVLAVVNAFALTMVPIAVGYYVAHYFSMLAVQGQDMIRLLSDPLGRGWNLFGTAKFVPDIGIFDARTTWFIAIAAIVAGHVAAIWLAHQAALREFAGHGRAVVASLPLTVLMVIYTAISLSIIAEPMVKFGQPPQMN